MGQRIYGLALGYEGLNDHDLLRRDPLLAAAVGKLDPEGQERRRETDRGAALAGKSTLNRLELRSDDPATNGRYKKIALDDKKVDDFFIGDTGHNTFRLNYSNARPEMIVEGVRRLGVVLKEAVAGARQ